LHLTSIKSGSLPHFLLNFIGKKMLVVSTLPRYQGAKLITD